MKKLMTMLAAVGMAFGLFADDPAPITPISSTSFEASESPAPFNGDNLIVNDDGGKWSCTDADAKLTKGVYEDGEKYTYDAQNDNPRYSAFSDQDNYLNVKTVFGKPLVRAASATVADKAIFFDQLVKFTACDSEPTAGYEDAKIVLYVRDHSEDETPIAKTNLYAVAGKYTGTALSTDTYDLGPIDIDAWHRVTIKTLKAYNNTAAAFEVFVDGVAATISAPAYDNTAAALLTPAAQALNAAKKLLPSMVADATFTSVGFDGQGAIDDLMVTTELPFNKAEDKSVQIKWDSHVTGLTYTANGVTKTLTPAEFEAGVAAVAYTSGMTISVNPTFDTANGWAYDKIVNEKDGNVLAEGDDMDFAPANDEIIATICSKDTTPRIQIGDNTYPNFAKAIAALPTSGDVTLTLNRNVDVGTKSIVIEQASYEITEATFDTGCNVTIDLNGKTITGKANGLSGYVIEADGRLTIIDNSQEKTGAIAMADETSYDGVVRVMSPNLQTAGVLTTTAGAFIGNVALGTATDSRCAATSDIVAGKFDKVSNPTWTLTKNADSEFVDDDNYWIVKVSEKYTLSVTGVANATFTINDQEVASVDLKAGASYSVVATAAANYEYKADGGYPAGWEFSEGKLVNAGTMGTAPIALTVPAPSAKVYTITYLDRNEVPYENLDDAYTKFTVETGSITPYEPTEISGGYEFSGWTLNDKSWTGDLTGITEDITVYSAWDTAHEYAITYVFVDENDAVLTEVTNPYAGTDSFTVETPNIEFTNDAELENYEFKGWTPATIVCVETFSDVVVTGKFESAVTPTPVPVDDPSKLDDNGKAMAQTVKDKFGDGLTAYTTAMGYTDGKIPAEKLNKTTDELIAAAKEYNLQIMADPVTVAVAATDAANTFKFTLTDKDGANPIVAATLIQKLVKYTTALGATTPFAESNAKAVDVKFVDGGFTAELTGKDDLGEAANAGFMKVDLSVAE